MALFLLWIFNRRRAECVHRIARRKCAARRRRFRALQQFLLSQQLMVRVRMTRSSVDGLWPRIASSCGTGRSRIVYDFCRCYDRGFTYTLCATFSPSPGTELLFVVYRAPLAFPRSFLIPRRTLELLLDLTVTPDLQETQNLTIFPLVRHC